jgi:hypothetical protein
MAKHPLPHRNNGQYVGRRDGAAVSAILRPTQDAHQTRRLQEKGTKPVLRITLFHAQRRAANANRASTWKEKTLLQTL